MQVLPRHEEKNDQFHNKSKGKIKLFSKILGNGKIQSTAVHINQYCLTGEQFSDMNRKS